MSGGGRRLDAVEWGALAALAALAVAVLAGLVLKVWLQRRRGHGRGRLPRRRSAAVPRLGAAGRRARPRRQPPRPRARRAGVPASRAAAVGPRVAARGRPGAGLPAVEAGRGGRAVRRHAGAGAPLPATGATTAGSRWCSRCSRARRWPRWSAGRGSGTRATKLQIDFVTGELWSGSYLWGYLFTAIAVGLLPLALLAYERGRGGGSLAPRRRAGLLCAWLQPWQGATLAFVLAGAEVVLVARGRAGARGRARARAADRGDRAAARLLRAAGPVRRVVGARGGGQRPAALVVVGAARGLRAARDPGRVRVPPARAGLRRRRPARLAARGAARVLPAARDVPVPRVPGPHAAARRCSACWRCGRWLGDASAAPGARDRRRRRARRRRDRLSGGEPRRRRPPRPPAVHAGAGRARRAALPRRAAGARRRARARLHRHRRPGLHGAGDVDRRGLVDAGPAAARGGGRGAVRRPARRGRRRGAGATVGRPLRAERLSRPRGHRRRC